MDVTKISKVYLFFSFFFFSTSVFSAEEFVDLGGLEIKGEVRRPSVQIIHAKSGLEKTLEVIVENHFKSAEELLLTPAALPLEFRKK